jgi:hypothetical protein
LFSTDNWRLVSAFGSASAGKTDRAERGHSLGFAFELERFDGLLAHEPIARFTYQRPQCWSGLLQARSHVDGIARDQPLRRRRILRDDFARVHARPIHQAQALALVDLVIQGFERRLYGDRRRDGTQRVVPVDTSGGAASRRSRRRHEDAEWVAGGICVNAQRLLRIFRSIEAEAGAEVQNALVLRVEVRLARDAQVQVQLLRNIRLGPCGPMQCLGVLEGDPW